MIGSPPLLLDTHFWLWTNAKALEQFDPFCYEDPIKMDNLDALADYAHRTNVWVTASETLGTRWGFRDLFEKRAASVCMLDVGWCGGLSESKKIATLAEASSEIAASPTVGVVAAMAAIGAWAADTAAPASSRPAPQDEVSQLHCPSLGQLP